MPKSSIFVKIRTNRYIRYFLLLIFRYIPNALKFNIKKVLRELGISRKDRFSEIKQFKNKHSGQRCFIVATGPSLNLDDLDKLKNEITFSMNSIVLSFDETNWRPTYYGIQDSRAYDALKSQIHSKDFKHIFCGISTKNTSPNINVNHVAYPLNLLNHNGGFLKHYTKFSNNAHAVVYDGFTITYSLLQLATYMGFKEIYLMGVDCNYPEKGKNHIKDYITQTDKNAGYLMEQSYKVARDFAEKHNIKIYNASRGGTLEVFERKELEDLEFTRESTKNEFSQKI
ncbi:DUF115 domain-containing protein [Bacillus zanthoxyli]|nr:DUF115 domain-containing protein [Bacillus zanthoxyli]